MAYRIKINRDGVLVEFLGAVRKQIQDDGLRQAFAQTIVGHGLDADSPYAEEVCKLIESKGWTWNMWEVHSG